jgi:hypothetical protein
MDSKPGAPGGYAATGAAEKACMTVIVDPYQRAIATAWSSARRE